MQLDYQLTSSNLRYIALYLRWIQCIGFILKSQSTDINLYRNVVWLVGLKKWTCIYIFHLWRNNVIEMIIFSKPRTMEGSDLYFQFIINNYLFWQFQQGFKIYNEHPYFYSVMTKNNASFVWYKNCRMLQKIFLRFCYNVTLTEYDDDFKKKIWECYLCIFIKMIFADILYYQLRIFS